MSNYTAIYSGSFGGNSAGADGLSTVLTGDALPENAKIVEVRYSIDMSAGGYTSSDKWVVHHFYLDDWSPSAPYKTTKMTGTKGTVSGTMDFSQSDVGVFNGSVTLSAKVNTTHSTTSYMRDVEITVSYTIGYNTSSIELSDTTIYAGNTIYVDLSNEEISDVYHKVTWSCGTKSSSSTLATGAKGTSFTIP